jgi:hypothetical protein
MNLHPDILVIGAGSAGLAAVFSAPQDSNHSFLLVEKLSVPGGKATSAYVGTVCGLFYTKPGKPEWSVNGWIRQFAEELQFNSKTEIQTHAAKLHFLPYQRQTFIDICNEKLRAVNVEVLYNTEVTNVKSEHELITEVQIITNGSVHVIYPKVVIDCTGTAFSAEKTGAQFIRDQYYQAAAQVFSISGVASADAETITLALGRAVRAGVANAHLREEISQVSVVKGMCVNGTVLLKLGIPLQSDHTDESQQRINQFAKGAINELVAYLKNQGGIFSNITIDFIAPEAGIRTGPRLQGQHTLTGEEVLSCQKFEDGIAKGTWPVEYWAPGKKVEMQYFADGDFYRIPAGSLRSNQFRNLFFAGRNISADETAIASVRVIGTCMQTGFAAAQLAVGYLRKETIQETIQTIQAEWTA